MKAKLIAILFVTTILALIWCSATWAGHSNIRNFQQAQRIRQGIRSNKITPQEALRLRSEQRRIHRAYQRASADGHISRHERIYLNKVQSQFSRHIYQAKHNHARRNFHRYYRKSAYHGIRHGHRYYRKSAYHGIRHGHFVRRHRIVSCYPPGARAGFAFSFGIGNRGW